jgi:hypothetical protein
MALFLHNLAGQISGDKIDRHRIFLCLWWGETERVVSWQCRVTPHNFASHLSSLPVELMTEDNLP